MFVSQCYTQKSIGQADYPKTQVDTSGRKLQNANRKLSRKDASTSCVISFRPNQQTSG